MLHLYGGSPQLTQLAVADRQYQMSLCLFQKIIANRKYENPLFRFPYRYPVPVSSALCNISMQQYIMSHYQNLHKWPLTTLGRLFVVLEMKEIFIRS